MSVHLPPDSLVDSWLVREGIGSGSHGAVLRVVHKDRPEAGSYALKMALKAGDERFEREAWLLSRIQHVRMLAEDTLARGSARQVAEELEALLEYSRPELDEPWQATATRQVTAKDSPPVPRENAPRGPAPRLASATRREPEPCLPPSAPGESAPRVAPAAKRESELNLAPAGVLLLLAVLGVLLTRVGDWIEVASKRKGSSPHTAGSSDGGTAVGEEGLASVRPAETAPDFGDKVTREMPDGPFPDQRRPPCPPRGVVVINGDAGVAPR